MTETVVGALRESGIEALEQQVAGWADGLGGLVQQIGRCFGRREARQRVAAYLTGLLSPIERKNGWQLAEQAGDATPYGMQHLLGRAQWAADAVRDDLQAYVRTHLADPAGVLVVDETSFLKKGTHSVGVGVQYSGITGKLENCQVGVFLVYASPKGQTFLDRALYVPKDWIGDAARRAAVGVPAAVDFATKPRLAQTLIERALDAGIPARWVTGDEVYGNDGRLRRALEERSQCYVLTVSAQTAVWAGWEQARVRDRIAALPATAWQRLSAGDGAKGPRLYDWARLPVNSPYSPDWERWLLARRSLTDPDDPRSIAYFLAFAPAETTLEELVRVAGLRWTIETCFETAKGEVGLDQYEVRSWHGWYRHITLALLAHAYLTVLRAHGRAAEAKKGGLAPPTPSRFGAFKQQRGLSCP